MRVNADLHCHSLYSDGVLTPVELVERAGAHGVTLWSLTDHDEVSGLAQAGEAARAAGLVFIPGVEVSVTWAGKTVHIVGLGVEANNTRLVDGLARIRAGRHRRAREMGDRLAQLGMPGALEGALPLAGNPDLISRTHFARFLVEAGYCRTMQQVFDKYLGDGKPAAVPVQWATLGQAVTWIHEAGGRAVIAHPGRYHYTEAQFDALLQQFCDLGGEGIEVVTGSHTPQQYQTYARVAQRYGLLASCGSDFHAPSEGRLDLGRLPPLPDGLTPVWHDWL